MTVTINGSGSITEEITIDGVTVGQGGGNVSTNTAVGAGALAANTTGLQSTSLGALSLASNTSGDGNTGIGWASLNLTTTGNYNTAVGRSSLGSSTTASNNTAIGYQALVLNTTASNNTAVGYQAVYSNQTGAYLVGVGNYALKSATAGANDALGYAAMYSTTTGINNVGIGFSSLYNNTSGASNTALGNQALQANTTASDNTAVGYEAAKVVTTGGNNTIIGRRAAHQLTTGTTNAFLGYNSGNAITTGSKNTIIGSYTGNQGGLDIRTSSNNIVLSDGDGNPRAICRSDIGYINWQLNCSLAGSYSTALAIEALGGTSSLARVINLNQNHNGQAICFDFNGSQKGNITNTGTAIQYNTTSDYRLKENVVELTGATDRLKQLPVHQFNFIADPDKTVDGFLAHEAQAVVPEAVTGTKDEVDDEGNPVYQGIDQSKLVPLLTAALKEAIAKIEALEARIAALETP